MRRVLLATMLATAVMPVASAHASQIYGDGSSFDFEASVGEANNVTITPVNTLAGPQVATVTDAGASLTGLGRCTSLATQTAKCQADVAGAPWNFNLGDRNDNVRWVGTSIGIQAEISGGDGNDTLAAPDGGSVIWGDAGNDVITGGAGVDTVYGGGGNNSINPGSGNDFVTVGAGHSSVDVVDGQADSVTCTDGGTATVQADPFDTVTGC
jgi:Ca2+-binding RTX toxin-like protein